MSLLVAKWADGQTDAGKLGVQASCCLEFEWKLAAAANDEDVTSSKFPLKDTYVYRRTCVHVFVKHKRAVIVVVALILSALFIGASILIYSSFKLWPTR